MSTKFSPSAADINNVSKLKAKGWSALTTATIIAARVDAAGVSLSKYVASANERLGASPNDGLGRIDNLVRVAREISATGIVIPEHAPSTKLDRLATILDQGYCGQWKSADVKSGIPKADVVPELAKILGEYTDNPAGAYNDIVALKTLMLEAAAEPKPQDVSESDATPRLPNDRPSSAQVAAPTPADILTALTNVKAMVDSLKGLDKTTAMKLLQTLHNIGDVVADKEI